MTTFDDEFYRDILDGIAVHAQSTFYRDVLETLSRHPEPRLGAALNKNQMASKRWLADALYDATGGSLGRVMILGGWVGALGAVLLHDRRFRIDGVVSIDVDAACAPVAESLNATHARTGRFVARTCDMLDVDYALDKPDVVINTSCEHLAPSDLERWFARIPHGQLLVVQSNDYVACAEHVNCMRDLAEFRTTLPLQELLFAGERPMRRYTRFMLIGRR